MEILIISGLSGAGKSSAATYLEDMGYYTVDNVPADIILKFAEFCAQSDGRYDRVALVSDIRSGNGNFQGILDAMERLKQGGDICRLLFVTADLETIIKRYKETRRRHPLMSDGMTIEQAMMLFKGPYKQWVSEHDGLRPDINDPDPKVRELAAAFQKLKNLKIRKMMGLEYEPEK